MPDAEVSKPSAVAKWPSPIVRLDSKEESWVDVEVSTAEVNGGHGFDEVIPMGEEEATTAQNVEVIWAG